MSTVREAAKRFPFAKTAAEAVRESRNVRFRYAGARFARSTPMDPQAAPFQLESNALTEYFRSHREGPGIMKPLNYFQPYDRHLRKFVGREVHVVEIGVYSGGSLGMWRHYFGSGCHVYGIDIEDECRRHEAEGVRIFIGDQADRAFWADFTRRVPRVDVVIDDGGHLAHQQIPTLEALLPHMAPGGVFICEDVGSPHNGFQAYVEGLSGHIHATGDLTTGFQQMVHSIHLYPYMVVVEKPEAPAVSFPDEAHGTEWAEYAPVAYGHRVDDAGR